MSKGTGTGWVIYVALLPMLTVSLVQARHWNWARLWPVWRPMMLDALLVVAAAVLVAAVIGGVVAWRQAKPQHA